MLDVNLASRAPALAPRSSDAGVTVAPLGPQGRLSLRIKPAALGDDTAIDGFDLSGPINSRRSAGDGAATRTALRLGPDEWMLLCPADDVEERSEALAAALNDTAHSLVDVSHRDVSFVVAGAEADSVINAGCPIDLALAAFPVGAATRTLLGKAEIVLTRLAEDRFTVTSWRSFAPYVQGFLVEAARHQL
ncbi:sarcosine oxidase subunit gamma [Jiella sp. MQZ9-1]|uniref:Sarcosine oxidase subunit gamma n=1 Tax=Jiella flava TaxID=2816857 RepID=A0A939FZ92_9HYPH|nr:sarcosine oxidase subunit gamma family protein [Jiella flava]MBO0664227.1 sarcosine oxidase subunit gamma [Jiella flava]MCD2472873.1 sarcosine oxidase subunit gamma [Jiella flava]